MHSTFLKTVVLAVLSVILIVVAGIGYWRYSHGVSVVPAESAQPTQSVLQAPQLFSDISTSTLVVVYITTATSTEEDNRNWPTKHVWLKAYNAGPVLIGTVGKLGEYPYQFVLSPDHAYVAINLEKAVDIINLQTKEKTRIFPEGKWIIGVGFSSDSSKLIIADGATYLGDTEPKPLYSVDINTGTASLLMPDVRSIGLYDSAPVVLRKDNVLLYYPVGYKDCGTDRLFSINLNNHIATSTYERYGISDDGMYAIGSALETVPVPAEQESMCSPGAYPTIVPVVDPLSGHAYGRVGKTGEPFTFVAFSPDHTQVLFKTSADLIHYAYYVQTVDEVSSPVFLQDPAATLSVWKASVGLAQYQEPETIYVGDTSFASTSEEWLQIIGQFYR